MLHIFSSPFDREFEKKFEKLERIINRLNRRPVTNRIKKARILQNKGIDFTELENEVIDDWENEGVRYFTYENNGFTAPDPEHYDMQIKPEFEAILSSPMACILYLGFDSISSYIASKE